MKGTEQRRREAEMKRLGGRRRAGAKSQSGQDRESPVKIVETSLRVHRSVFSSFCSYQPTVSGQLLSAVLPQGHMAGGGTTWMLVPPQRVGLGPILLPPVRQSLLLAVSTAARM